MSIRPDLYFSYWIFLWAVVYLILFFNNKHNAFVKNCNPFIIFVIALIENIIVVLFMIYKSFKVMTILLFSLMVLFVKIIPMILLYKAPIKIVPNVISLLLLFLLYNIYLLLIGNNIFNVYINSIDELLKQETPFIYFITHKIFPLFNIKNS